MRQLHQVARVTLAATLLFSMAGVASAQSPIPGAPAPTLAGTDWTLKSAAVPATLHIDGMLASGFGGCNRYMTTVTSMDPGLTFGDIASTQMACPGPQMAAEQQYFSALGTVADYTIAGQTLTLLDGSSTAVLVFEAGPAATLEGAWVVTGYNNGRNGVETPPNSSLTADFAADGTVSGNGGCNNFHGGYSYTTDTIAIGPLMSTAMACDEATNTLEQQYLAALQNATVWSILNGSLEFRDDSGALQVSFVRP